MSARDRTVTFLLKINHQLDKVERELSRFGAQVERLGRARISIPVDVSGLAEASTELSGIEEQVERLDGRSVDIGVSARNAANTESDLRDVSRAAAAVGRSDPTADVDVRGATSSLSEISTVNVAAENLDGKDAVVDVSTRGVPGTIASLTALRSALRRAADQGVNEFNRQMLVLRNVGQQAARFGILGLVGAIGPMTGALTIGASALGSVAAGFGLLGLAAIPTIRALSGESGKLTESQRELKAAATEFYRTFERSFASATGRVEGLATATIHYAQGALPALGRAAEATADALGQAGTALRRAFEDPRQLALFSEFLSRVPNMTRLFTQAVGRFAVGLFNILVAAQPAAERFLGYLDRISAKFLRFTRGAEGQKSLREFFAQVGPVASAVARAIGSVAKGLFALSTSPEAVEFFTRLANGIAFVGERLPSLRPLFGMLNQIARAFASLPAPMRSVIVQAGLLYGAFALLGGPVVLGFLRPLVSVVGGLLRFRRSAQAAGGVLSLLKTRLGFLGPVFSQVGSFVSKVLPVIGRLALTFFRVIRAGALIRAALVAIGAALGLVSAPVAIAIGVIAGLVAVGYLVYRNWNRIGPLLGKAWQAVRQRAVAIWNGTKGFLLGVWRGLRGAAAPILNAVKGAFSKAWNAIQNVTRAVWKGIRVAAITALGLVIIAGRPILNAIKDAVSAAWKTIRGLTKSVWSGIRGAVWNFLKPYVKGAVNAVKNVAVAGWNALKVVTRTAWNGIKAAISATWNFLKPFVKAAVGAVKASVSAGWNFLKNATRTAWNAIKAIFAPVWGAIKSVVSSALGFLKGAIAGAWNQVKSMTSGAWNAVKGVISGAWNSIKSIISSGVSAALGVIRDFGERLFDLGKAAIQGLINGIKSMAGAVAGAIGDLLRRAYEEGKRAIKSRSPSRLFEVGIGHTIPQGAAQGVRRKASLLVAEIRRMLGSAEREARRAPLGALNLGPSAGGLRQQTAQMQRIARMHRQMAATSVRASHLMTSATMRQVAALRQLQREMVRTANTSRYMAGPGSAVSRGAGTGGSQVTTVHRTEQRSYERVDVYFHGPGADQFNNEEMADLVGKNVKNNRRRG